MAIAGMSLLQVAQLIGALAGAVKDIQAVHDDLTAKGHPQNVPIPPESAAAVQNALDTAAVIAAQKSRDEDHSN
jgi:hypothetical protein